MATKQPALTRFDYPGGEYIPAKFQNGKVDFATMPDGGVAVYYQLPGPADKVDRAVRNHFPELVDRPSVALPNPNQAERDGTVEVGTISLDDEDTFMAIVAPERALGTHAAVENAVTKFLERSEAVEIELLTQPKKSINRTLLVLTLLGYQGGTVHQANEELAKMSGWPNFDLLVTPPEELQGLIKNVILQDTPHGDGVTIGARTVAYVKPTKPNLAMTDFGTTTLGLDPLGNFDENKESPRAWIARQIIEKTPELLAQQGRAAFIYSSSPAPGAQELEPVSPSEMRAATPTATPTVAP